MGVGSKAGGGESPSRLPSAEGLRLLTAADLMNSDVLTVDEDDTVQELARFLRENEISGAPVLNRGRRLVGVVSLVDVARAASFEGALRLAAPDYYGRSTSPLQEGDEEESLEVEGLLLRVADIMTPTVFSVEEDTPVKEIADLMLHSHLHRVLVLRRGELVGIVSSSDLLGLLVGE